MTGVNLELILTEVEERKIVPRKIESKVSEKSTKVELWQAYNEAVAGISGEDAPVIDDKLISSATKNLSEVKIKISSELDDLQRKLSSDFNDLGDISDRIRKDKKSMLENFENQRKILNDEISRVRASWIEEQKLSEETSKMRSIEIDKLRNRENEEYNYNLSLSRKKENDLWKAEKEERERILKSEEAKILERKEEISVMEKELAKMPVIIEKEVETACASLEKDLNQKYGSRIKELEILKEHEMKMAEIKIANLDSLAKSQTEEIEDLKKQLHSNNLILKDMAVISIEAKGGKFKASVDENK